MNVNFFVSQINNFFLFLRLQSLTLLEYLLKTGSDRIPKQSQENIHVIKPLIEYRFTDKDGKDQVPELMCSLILWAACLYHRCLTTKIVACTCCF